MGSLYGMFQRPVTAAAAIAIAAVSVDLPEKLPTSTSLEKSSINAFDTSEPQYKTWASLISGSKLSNVSLATKLRRPVPDVKNLASVPEFYLNRNPLFGSMCMSVASHPTCREVHRVAKLGNAPLLDESVHFKSSPQSEVMYIWHLPKSSGDNDLSDSECSSAKSRTVVVLLGWLGAKQKHLKRYAEWYTSRGYHAITFTFPMSQVLSYQVGGKAEQHVDDLVNHLAGWLEEEHEKNLVFHTFSNTGWLTYGVMLEKFQKQDLSLMGNIKGCIVDSAPVAAPDPRVWASGFSAAFFKKQSIATRGMISSNGSGIGVMVDAETTTKSRTAVTETALLAVLEKFFEVVLNLPKVNRRLSDVLDVLSVEQPKCPQLYIYSSADRVIPVESVESFIEKQRKTGRVVRSCDFVSTPHVDHFRNDPNLYTSQLTNFLEDCVFTCCKHSS